MVVAHVSFKLFLGLPGMGLRFGPGTWDLGLSIVFSFEGTHIYTGSTL